MLILMGALVMIQHFIFSSAALQLAAATIAREKQALTWESLLLTGVDARRIIVGKWAATMRTLWLDYRMLLPLRFAIGLLIGLADRVVLISPYFTSPPFFVTVLIAVMVAVFPLSYAAFTTTLGLLASLLTNSETAANRLGGLLHFGTIALSLSLLFLLLALPFFIGDNGNSTLAPLIPAFAVTPIDGGMLALFGLLSNNGASSSGVYLIGLILCMIFYAGLTLVALRAAQALAVRQRATPPSPARRNFYPMPPPVWLKQQR